MRVFNTVGEWKTLPDQPNPSKNIMKAKVIKETTVYNKPVKVGTELDVDENTFRNLALKGRLEAVDQDAKKVDLKESSRLSEEEAEERQSDAKKEAAKKVAAKHGK